MLPLFVAALSLSSDPVAKAYPDGLIAVMTTNNNDRIDINGIKAVKCEMLLLDTNGKLVESLLVHALHEIGSIQSFRLMPGSKTVLFSLLEFETRKVGKSNIRGGSGVLLDLTSQNPRVRVFEREMYQQGLPSHDGKAIYVTENIFPDPPGPIIHHSWLFDPTTKRSIRIPLSADQHLVDISHDGQSALIDTKNGTTYDLVSTVDWKPKTKAIPVYGGARLAPDGQTVVYRDPFASDRRGKLSLAVRKHPFQERTVIALPDDHRINEFAVAPDGKRLVITMSKIDRVRNVIDYESNSLYVVNLDGSNLKLIHRFKNKEMVNGIDWR